MKLNSLSIKNYKLLNDFNVEKLGKLNLIVGKNNSGKSTVLECLQILASNGNPSIINRIIEDHDDQLLSNNRTSYDDPISVYEGLFTDRIFPEKDEPIYIGTADRKNYVEINPVFLKM